ncbi:MAG: hypothetical protein ABJC07_02080 [Acidobacteriota bacterium]
MGPYLCGFCFVFGLAVEPPDWTSLRLRIQEDSSISSDTATLCRVEVVNSGPGTWDGRGIVFEARALRDGRVASRVQGRFGGTLGPLETLETAIGFSGKFHRFEVSPSSGGRGSGSVKSRQHKRSHARGSRKKTAHRN